MRDKVLTYAIVASIALHLVAACVVGHAWAARLQHAAVAVPQKLLRVDFVGSPEPPKPKPKPAVVRQPRPVPPPAAVRPIPAPATPEHAALRPSAPPRPALRPNPGRTAVRPTAVAPRPIAPRPGGTGRTPPGNPGGPLHVGSPSRNGDVPGNWASGRTRPGWVPGTQGTGFGSGAGPGVGRPDPPKHVDPGPGTRPAPAPPPPPPPPPPAPKKVSVRVCDASGLLPGEHCKGTHSETFTEGREPGRRCDRCKAPEPPPGPKPGDRANPILERDSSVNTASLDEGLNVTVVVAYTVTADGDVSGVSVSRSSGNSAADRAVVSAASKLSYKPAIQNGVRRSVKMTRTYRIRT